IFISYRRADSASAAGRLYDRLAERYGRASVFKDVDSIPPGAHFPAYIAESIEESDVTLVVIGPHWLDASSGFGRRRLDDPADFVRIEIETALTLGVPVIPVLVEGANLPPARRLPPSLRLLLEQNAVPLRPDPDFSRDMERIVTAVEYWQAQPRRAASEAVAPTSTPPTTPSVAPATLTPPVAQSATKAPRTATAVAEQIGIATRQKRTRWKPGRGASALGATAVMVALIVTLVAVLHYFPTRAGSFSAGDPTAHRTATSFAATTTALAVLGKQPFTGLGPCDTKSIEQYNYQSNPYFWSYTKDRSTCVGGSSVALVIPSSVVNQASMTFYGLPYYSNSRFPSTFTATMTLAFTYTDRSTESAQTDCAGVGWSIPNETDSQWVDALSVCQDGTWHLSATTYDPGATRHSIDIAKPFAINITVANSSIGVTINGVQALPMTHFTGLVGSFNCMLTSAPPASITVSHFAFSPGVA
ncbi:MAG: toll/interleukin-1 receptor domain-containing protein, partial [Ktedonobacterales bacterium]